MAKTRELTNAELVTLAVARLGGGAAPVDVEDIAIEAYSLAPSRFCWKKHPDKIDLIIVRVSLNDAWKSKPPLLRGSIKAGYMLTARGLQWSSGADNVAGQGLDHEARRNSVLAALEKERERLTRSKAYAKFSSGKSDQLSMMDFREFARVNDYFSPQQREKRYAIIDNAVRGFPDLQDVWDALRARHGQRGGA